MLNRITGIKAIWLQLTGLNLRSRFLIMDFSLWTQIINEPTHILEDALSCIDLIFTQQPNMFLDSRVHSSLHPNSHHQIAFAKFSLKVYYPPPYERHIWHYKYANTVQIKMHLHLSTGNKHLIIALSIRRFLFSVKRLQCYEQLYFQRNKGFWWPETALDECGNWELNYRKNDVFKKQSKSLLYLQI